MFSVIYCLDILPMGYSMEWRVHCREYFNSAWHFDARSRMITVNNHRMPSSRIVSTTAGFDCFGLQSQNVSLLAQCVSMLCVCVGWDNVQWTGRADNHIVSLFTVMTSSCVERNREMLSSKQFTWDCTALWCVRHTAWRSLTAPNLPLPIDHHYAEYFKPKSTSLT